MIKIFILVLSNFKNIFIKNIDKQFYFVIVNELKYYNKFYIFYYDKYYQLFLYDIFERTK